MGSDIGKDGSNEGLNQVEKALDGGGYEEVASPGEDVELPTMRDEVPEVVPIPQEGVDRDEPDPSQYNEWSTYVHDLLEFEIGYQADQAAVADPENPANPANNGTVLEGDLVDVTAGDYGVEVVYAIKDHFLEQVDFPVQDENEMPDIWGETESTTTIEYDADSFRELREETRRVAEYLTEVDQAISTQAQP